MSDSSAEKACSIVSAARDGSKPRAEVKSFFDEPTNLVSYVVHDPESREAAVIDSVLNFDSASGRTSHASSEAIIDYVNSSGLTIRWLLETHAHADHLSAAPYLQSRVGGKLCIGRDIVAIQNVFGKIFNMTDEMSGDGSEFDRLFSDGDCFSIGNVEATVLQVPGHTSADVAYVIGDSVFTGDTLFMPDFGTARTDFPGGSSRQLYRSIRRLLSLPDDTRLFMCHDYKAPGRSEFAWETTVRAQREGNVHIRDGVTEDDFVRMRDARDATLPMPKLIVPSIQVNIRGGRLPKSESNGTRYLKIPLDAL
jgi:glyoxylase-like metal-dependent hydrolase (beta-lactamase superfamily II)